MKSMPKKLKARGKNISKVEVSSISQWGLWLLVNEQEFFLPYSEYPWFEEASVGQICDVELHHNKYLHWPVLDVDLEIESLKNPGMYPLTYK